MNDPSRSARFSRSRRLNRGEDFQRLYRQGQSVRGGWLTLKILPNGRGSSRFGCTVRREVARGGVLRNRLKRWMREAFRRNQRRLPGGLDILAVMQGMPPRRSYQEIEETFLRLCGRMPSRPGSA